MTDDTRPRDIAVITLASPPVNALGIALRRHIVDSLAQAEADPQVRAILLVGSGRAFSAGADIREFGQPPQQPALPEVCNRIEACTKPVVAAIHGAALGGGLEVALAAHYRARDARAKLGLPEVQLGLLPGAGGTQRAPRLIGVKAALDLMLSGRQAGAKEALELGPGRPARRRRATCSPQAWPMRASCSTRRAGAPHARRDASAGRPGGTAPGARGRARRDGEEGARPVLAAEDRRGRRGRARPAVRRRAEARARAVPAVHRQPAARRA